MDFCFLLIKVTVIILSIVVIVQNVIYMLLHTNDLITASEIPHITGMIVGLFMRICGLVAAIREQLILTVIYGTVMALITILTPFNVQFIVNLLTTIMAFIYALAIKLRSIADRSSEIRSPDAENAVYHPQHSSRADYNQTEQPFTSDPHPSAPPSEAPPYYGPPPPPYEESIK